MMNKFTLAAAALAVSAPAFAQTETVAYAEAAARPVVVELYTSQGCPNCPRANALAGELSGRPDVLALSFGVDYWDYRGWRDTFAQPEFTARQRAYAERLANRRVYTPQMVIDGVADISRPDRARVERAVAERALDMPEGPEVEVVLAGAHAFAAVSAADTPREREADVWLVAFEPGVQHVRIDGGANRGAAVAHFNVVTRIERLGGWTGETAAEFPITADEAGGFAVLVQEPDAGPILAAARFPTTAYGAARETLDPDRLLQP